VLISVIFSNNSSFGCCLRSLALPLRNFRVASFVCHLMSTETISCVTLTNCSTVGANTRLVMPAAGRNYSNLHIPTNDNSYRDNKTNSNIVIYDHHHHHHHHHRFICQSTDNSTSGMNIGGTGRTRQYTVLTVYCYCTNSCPKTQRNQQ